ncbi:RICIN domain-containing protein [Streptacidiphilus melanogenes]|uniref:RICIN domain-containing protein n=1 Tax=Streptacidiphilus melanogenes TaxID=411235 RepID=UPI0005A99439|nr:RICIN domain-containing protein [Streptacidiphilus melanogenes]
MRKKLATAVLTGAALLATGLGANPASALPSSATSPIAFNNDLCMDVPNSNAVVGQQLQQWTCNGTDAQMWTTTWVDATHFQVHSGLNYNLCMNNWEGGDNTGNHIALYNCETTPDGLFNYVSTGSGTQIQPKSAWHTCVNGWGGDAAGNQLRLFTCQDVDNEDLIELPMH